MRFRAGPPVHIQRPSTASSTRETSIYGLQYTLNVHLLLGIMRLRAGSPVQGYLAHKKPRPQGPFSRTIPRALWWPYGGGAVSYERGTSVHIEPPSSPDRI